jgi:hypothetical protein
MNNTVKPNATYLSLDFWLNAFGSPWVQEIANLTLIPIGFFGFIFNIMALIILNGKQFDIPVYEYIRIYTINSGVICLFTITRFINNTRRFFSWSNTQFANRYFVYFYSPVTNSLFVFGAFMDIILTFDRIVMFSNRFHFFKKFKPKIVSLVVLIASFVSMATIWISYTSTKRIIRLNETYLFTMNYMGASKYKSIYIYVYNGVIMDVIPVIIEICLNISTIISLKTFIKKKKSIRTGMTSSLITNLKSKTNDSENKNQKVNKAKEKKDKSRMMEIKVTILIITMSFLSIM